MPLPPGRKIFLLFSVLVNDISFSIFLKLILLTYINFKIYLSLKMAWYMLDFHEHLINAWDEWIFYNLRELCSKHIYPTILLKFLILLFVCLFVCVMTDCYSVAQAALNSWQSFCLSLLSARIKGVSNLPGFSNGLFWQLSFSPHQNMPRAPNRTAHLYDSCSYANVCFIRSYRIIVQTSIFIEL